MVRQKNKTQQYKTTEAITNLYSNWQEWDIFESVVFNHTPFIKKLILSAVLRTINRIIGYHGL